MDRTELVERYKQGVTVVNDALVGISDGELDARPEPGEWTPREIVHHLADGEMTSAIRLRRLLTEDNPTIEGYDQEAFARDLFYDERPIQASLDALAAARATTAEILDHLTEDQWSRSGTHTESGPYSVDTWLGIYASHAHDHAAQIERARSASG
jgi:hypothetical protein